MTSPPQNARKAQLSALLKPLAPSHIELVDSSSSHVGHLPTTKQTAPTETHFRLTIIAECFEGLSRLERSRLIHKCLKSAWEEGGADGGLHALEITALSPTERR